jgi:hypothetical protein
VVDQLPHPNCGSCQAVLPRNLTPFHKLWHQSQTGRSAQFFEDQYVDPAVAQMLQVVAALRSVPPVTARTKFVKDLRERLITGTFDRASK